MELSVQSANVLFVYDNVIKTPEAYMLKLAATKYRDKLDEFMHLELPLTSSIPVITQRMVRRTKKNPIEWLAKKEFDYDKLYEELKAKSIKLYEDSVDLKSAGTLKIFTNSYCIGKIYIWNNVYDKRQMYDISGVLDKGHGKVEYVVSPTLQQAIDTIGNLHVVYDWDIDRVYEMVSTGLNEDILFAVANYPFNFNLDNPNVFKYDMANHKNVAPFVVYHDNEEANYYG